ncbi:hypothetical protein SUGI_0472690 [Cryptomeria japonica]|nr:hypothetical protein SUGI_0472690 [Cryptomeria japonica]
MNQYKAKVEGVSKYLCAWGNDAASEVITKARQLLVENYFQTPSLAFFHGRPLRSFGGLSLRWATQIKK